jgi:hypothetical protein
MAAHRGRAADEGGTIAVALLAEFNVNAIRGGLAQ